MNVENVNIKTRLDYTIMHATVTRMRESTTSSLKEKLNTKVGRKYSDVSPIQVEGGCIRSEMSRVLSSHFEPQRIFH